VKIKKGVSARKLLIRISIGYMKLGVGVSSDTLLF